WFFRSASNCRSDSPSTPAAPRFAFTRRYASTTNCFGISNALALAPRSSPLGWRRAAARLSDPFAPAALPAFTATTGPSAPSRCIGTLLLVGPPLGVLPSHHREGSHVPYPSL